MAAVATPRTNRDDVGVPVLGEGHDLRCRIAFTGDGLDRRTSAISHGGNRVFPGGPERFANGRSTVVRCSADRLRINDIEGRDRSVEPGRQVETGVDGSLRGHGPIRCHDDPIDHARRFFRECNNDLEPGHEHFSSRWPDRVLMTVYVATRAGLLIVEGRESQDPAVEQTLVDAEPECLAVHPAAPERVFCGTFRSGLHRSTDGGASWERVGTTQIDPEEDPEQTDRRGAAGGISVMAVAIDPSDPDRIWAGTEPSALFRSSDGGETWQRIGGLNAVDSVDEWAFPPRPYTHHVRCLAIHPTDPDRVYVGIEAGAFLLSTDGGETWTDRPSGSRRDNHSLAVHPDATDRVYAAAGDGYAESIDGGRHWEHPQQGLDHRYVWGLAVDSGDPETVLVSAAHGAGDAHGHGGTDQADAYCYRRVETEWERCEALPTGPGVVRPTLASGRHHEFVAASNRGLYRSPDRGASWERCPIDWTEYVGDQGARAIAVVD